MILLVFNLLVWLLFPLQRMFGGTTVQAYFMPSLPFSRKCLSVSILFNRKRWHFYEQYLTRFVRFVPFTSCFWQCFTHVQKRTQLWFWKIWQHITTHWHKFFNLSQQIMQITTILMTLVFVRVEGLSQWKLQLWTKVLRWTRFVCLFEEIIVSPNPTTLLLQYDWGEGVGGKWREADWGNPLVSFHSRIGDVEWQCQCFKFAALPNDFCLGFKWLC